MEFDKIEFLVKEMKDAVKKMNDVAKLLDEENVLFHIDTDSETTPSPNVRFPLRCNDFYTTETKIIYYGK